MGSNSRAVIIVGAGGIGSCLFQDLVRFLPHTIDVHLMDGDTVEGKNLARQHFSKKDLGRNKAEALAERATTAIGLDRVYYHPVHLTEPAQLDRIASNYYHYYGPNDEGIILVGAVDNHPARRMMEQFVREAGRPVYYLDCANEESRGEVVAVYVTKGKTMRGAFRSDLDPRVKTDNTGDPTKASCNQQLDAGNIQTLYTNRKAAIIALEMIGAHIKGETKTGIVYFRDCVVTRVKEVDTSDGSPGLAIAK